MPKHLHTAVISSLKGIFGLVTQVLGVTAEYIRSKAVKMFGDATVARMEKSVAIFQVVSQGPEALWEHVSEQFTDLKETVIGEIKNLVITQVIQAGVKWILSLLNPVSGLIKAAMGIYDIITFFMNRASQIMDLVNAVIEAVKAIAAGQLSGAASLVENALVRSLPVMIGFLASLLGVNGLATKVQNIVKKIRTRIDKAIDQFLLKAKRLSKGDKGKDNKDKNSNEAQEGKVSDEEGPEHDLKVKTGLTQLEQEQARYLKNGAITQEDAEKVAAKVKKDNPVFKSIEVVDGQDAWDYTYVASPKRTRSGAKKAEDSADNSVNARELLHNARDNWNEAKRRYVPKSKMAPLLKLRTEVVGKIITDIQKETPVDAEITSNNQSVAKLPAEPQPAFKPIAPGSGDPTSDYDVTFSAGRGDKKAEIFAVKRFNEVFRGEWKKESGTVFDTNVYTTGHMPKTSSNTPTSDAFGATNKEIEDLEYKEKKGRITEEEKLRIQDLQEERNSLSKQLGKEIDDEKENKWGNLVSSDKFNVDQDIMSLVKIRRFMSQREWNRYKKDMLKPYQRVPGKEALYQETERRLTAAEKFYNDSERDLQVKLAEVRAAKKLPSPAAQKGKTDGRLLASKELKEAEDNAVLQASNELYVQCLEKVEEVLRKIDKVEQRKQENPKGTEVTELDELIYEFHLHHSKGLYYANEAYHTGGAAEHVVLNQQMKLGIKLTLEQYLQSVNEQTGFVMEQIEHHHQLGRCLWASAKYLERIGMAEEEIKKELGANSINRNGKPDLMKMAKQLVKEVKKNNLQEGEEYETIDKQKIKNKADMKLFKNKKDMSTEIAKNYSIRTIPHLKKALKEWNLEINHAIRAALTTKSRVSSTSKPEL